MKTTIPVKPILKVISREQVIHKVEADLENTKKREAHLTKLVFWSTLLVMIIGNLLVSIVLVPFLLALNKTILLAIITLMGLLLGFIYNHLLTTIQHLERKHHVFAGIIIPVVALSSLFLAVFISNLLIIKLKINNGLHSYWLLGLLFAGAFILPYFIKTIVSAIAKK
ncbi:hypothetical protein J4437_04650 [Candidatus Woesearchaeota archaeon]|nr:hypothetical protein [Candidatus Woesearchaeota archaeon]